MRALALRFYHFTGVLGRLWILIGVFLIGAGAAGVVPFDPVIALYVMVWIGAIAIAAVKYHRPSFSRDYADALTRPVPSDREYCVVLRPFGRDGEVIVPMMNRSRLITPNMTMEQILALAARRALGLETYAIVDQQVRLAPPGPRFVRASENHWKTAAQDLIRRAHSIFLLLPPGKAIGEGLAWEIDQIVQHGMQSRVIIVLPPYDQGPNANQVASSLASVVLARLDGSDTQGGPNGVPAPGYRARLPANSLLARWSIGQTDSRSWGAAQVPLRGTRQPTVKGQERVPLYGAWEKKKTVTAADYIEGLLEALDEIDVEWIDAGLRETASERHRQSTSSVSDRCERSGEGRRLEEEHRQNVIANRARWESAAETRVKLRAVKRRIEDERDPERVSYAKDEVPFSRSLLSAAALVVCAFLFGAWTAAAVAFGISVVSATAARRKARVSLRYLRAYQRELQERLGCGRVGCQRCGVDEPDGTAAVRPGRPRGIVEPAKGKVGAAWRRWKATPLS